MHANFVEQGALVNLVSPAVVRLLGGLAASGVGGGRTYDAVIGACAAQAQAHTLLTFNRRHFDPPPDGVAVVEPAGTG